MTTDMQLSPTETRTLPPFGARLQSARETLGLDIKDAAAQLRLNEKIISMLETDCYGTDIPPTFVRGYIRSYGKLLQIPETEINAAVEPIKPKTSTPIAPTVSVTPDAAVVTSSNYFMQLFTYLIVLTLITLMAIWWYNHSSQQSTTVAEAVTQSPIKTAEQSVTFPLSIKTDAVASNVNVGAKVDEAVPTPALPTTVTAEAAPTQAPVNVASAQPVAPKKALASTAKAVKHVEDDESEEE